MRQCYPFILAKQRSSVV